MKKSTRIVKKLLALFLVVLMSINTLGAVVSDNDGSAFITKAEFDSLKNDFQSQIDQYNTSIDAKIDGAIASYLAGIQLVKETKLENLFETIGGNEIKFGFIEANPNTNEVAGWATYWENGDTYGVSTVRMGAQHTGIRDGGSSEWTNSTRGGGTYGKMMIYKENNGNKYLDKYFYGMLQAVFAGGWWTGATTVRKCMVNGPWGAGEANVNEPLTPISGLYTDFYTSFYRVFRKNPDLDLSMWTSGYAVNTSATKVFISEKNFGKANARLVNKGSGVQSDNEPTANSNFYNGQAAPDGTRHDKDDIVYNNLKYYDWNTETGQAYTSLHPGFYNGKKYNNSLYGGVHLFESEKGGTVKIEKLKFSKSESGDVWFAINSAPFANTDILRGDVKFTSVSGAILVDSTRNYYKAARGDEVTLTFDINKGMYYIKCQPNSTKSLSNTLYCGIENGAEITATYD